MADEQREGLAHAIVYPTKTKLIGDFKNSRRRVATQMHCNGTSNSHQSVGANAADEAKKNGGFTASSAFQRDG